MIPICLVTGFLGSGKTTFLKHLVATRGDERIVFLVNEFSPHNVDGALLEQVEEDVVAIPGGSIFCRCLVTQFLGNLRAIPDRFDREDDPLAGVVIEASGVANPMVIEQMLAETRLDEVYELATIIAVVDPGSLPKLVQTLPNIRAQIEAADVVLLNKVDRFGPDEVAEAERIVRRIKDRAPIVRTVRCATEIDLFAGGGPRGLQGDYAPCADPSYTRFSVGFDGPVDVAGLTCELERLREDIYRAKGVVQTADGYAYVDMTAAELIVEGVRDFGAEPGLAIIARGDASEGVQDLVRRLSGS
ncbi:MAG: GTP-binding protein [Armatimonadota bacterium]|jgi:G3E family GTPase